MGWNVRIVLSSPITGVVAMVSAMMLVFIIAGVGIVCTIVVVLIVMVMTVWTQGVGYRTCMDYRTTPRSEIKKRLYACISLGMGYTLISGMDGTGIIRRRLLGS